MKSKNTIEAVAKLAKVSPATVSRVINRTSRVSAPVESRIRAAAEKLGVNLKRKNKTKLIAFLLSNRSLLYPFHSQVFLAVQGCCAVNGYSLLFFPLQYSQQQSSEKLDLPPILQRSDVIDGLIVSGVNHQNLLDALGRTGLPFAILGDTVHGPWRESEYDVVRIDDTDGAYQTTRYLLSLGHTRIAYVANARLVWFERRAAGYKRAMDEADLPSWISTIDSENEHEVGFLGTKAILAQGRNEIDAIFAGSDAIAYGVYSALREAGIAVPRGVSVCGFNDTPDASLLHPPLTSVCVFPDLIGRTLSELLLERIADPSVPARSRILHTQLIKRESCLPSLRTEMVSR